MAKTKFNKQWLDAALHPDFATWLSDVNLNNCQGYCRICSKTFELSNMGVQAVKSHASGNVHIKNLKMKMSQKNISGFIFKKPSSNKEELSSSSDKGTFSTPSSKDENCAVSESIQAQKVNLNVDHNNLSTYLLKDDVRKAECLWAMQVVMKKMSFNSCNNVSELFKTMFPDSSIARQFQLGSSKASYTILYGLAPYFQDKLLLQLKNCKDYVVCFDEALNKVVQKGQMDLLVRFWDEKTQKVSTRYFNSVFMGNATSDDILEKFKDGISPLLIKNLLQVSMDGPNVNLAFIKKLKDKEFQDSEKMFMDLGTCGIHTVHGAYKTGLSAAKWDINTLLRHMYYLLRDSPARRATYTFVTGNTLVPLKYCATRWVENSKCLERAIIVFDDVVKFVKSSKSLNSLPAESVKMASNDPLMKCKMSFCKMITSEIEPFLRKYQSAKPMICFLYEDLHSLLRKLLTRCIKGEKLEHADTAVKLLSLDLKSTENLLELTNVDVGFSVRKLLKITKISEPLLKKFRLECRQFLVAVAAKLIEKSPLKFKMVRGLSCLDPEIIFCSSTIGIKRMEITIQCLHDANRISEDTAERAKAQYITMTKNAKSKWQEIFKDFLKEGSDKTLDDFYHNILENEKDFCDLWKVVKLCLIFSHGNASVESGFSINKSILIENLHEQSIVRQRLVYDAVMNVGGIDHITIDKTMLQSVGLAYKRYKDHLEKIRQLNTKEEIEAIKKRKITFQMKALEQSKEELRKKARIEEETINIELQQLAKKRREM